MTKNQQIFRWQMNPNGPETYEQYIVPTWMNDWALDLLKAARIGRGQRVLDAACGTGIVARKAAGLVASGGRIAALDANEGMLRVGEGCAEREGLRSIGWYRGDICHMPFFAGEFDAVLCQQGLQFFPDKPAALQEIKRVLAPGGMLALSVWGRPEKSPHVPVICEVFPRYLGEDSTTIFKVACSLSDRTKLRQYVHDAGFSKIRIKAGIKTARHPLLAELLPAYFSVFPVAARIAAMPEEERNAMFRCIAEGLADYTENEGLAVPTESLILTARRPVHPVSDR